MLTLFTIYLIVMLILLAIWVFGFYIFFLMSYLSFENDMSYYYKEYGHYWYFTFVSVLLWPIAIVASFVGLGIWSVKKVLHGN